MMCKSPAKHMSDHSNICDVRRGRKCSSKVTDDEGDGFDEEEDDGRTGKTRKEKGGKDERLGGGGREGKNEVKED